MKIKVSCHARRQEGRPDNIDKRRVRALRRRLSKKGMNLQEGLRKAALAMVSSNFEIDPNDPFFKIRAVGGSRDLSKNHVRYLYQETRQRSLRRSK